MSSRKQANLRFITLISGPRYTPIGMIDSDFRSDVPIGAERLKVIYMCSAVLDLDERSGELVTGYFYLLETFTPYDDIEKESEDEILGAGDRKVADQGIVANFIGHNVTESFDCETSSRHLTWEAVESIRVEIVSGEHRLDFIRQDGPFLIVDRRLREAIEASVFKGAHFCPVNMLHKENASVADLELFGLMPQPNRMCRLSTVRPEAANRCFKCGFFPICCPTCGHVENDCPRCGEEVAVYEEEHDGANDSRIKIKTARTGFNPIIEVGKWDGRDVLGRLDQPIVTKRVIDFLLARHSSLFRATPLRANIAGISEEKRQLLEIATRLPH